jgi:protein PhnA
MSDDLACPICALTDLLEHPEKHECATCGHEWPRASEEAGRRVVKDSNGNVLEDGDAVTLIKDLKVKGSSVTLKIGTKIKSIRLVQEGDHEIDAKADGMGIMLRAKFVKKA